MLNFENSVSDDSQERMTEKVEAEERVQGKARERIDSEKKSEEKQQGLIGCIAVLVLSAIIGMVLWICVSNDDPNECGRSDALSEAGLAIRQQLNHPTTYDHKFSTAELVELDTTIAWAWVVSFEASNAFGVPSAYDASGLVSTETCKNLPFMMNIEEQY